MTTVAALVILILCIAGMHCEQCAERPPKMEKEDLCCNININNEQIECLERVHEQWRLLHQSKNKESFVKTQDMCLSNCVFNNTNIITSDNKVNPGEIKNFMEKLLATEWLPESTKMIEMCTERVDNFKPHVPRESSMGTNSPLSNCNMAAEKLFMCIHQEIVNACPDPLWRNEKECNDLRAYLKNCPIEKRGHNKQQP